MSNFNHIEEKLQHFSKKYYTNELIRGSILFLTLGLLYFLFTLFIEYFLWLKPNARTFLFWLFVAVELFLLARFIVFPLFKLFGLQKGISNEDASKIIGNHFPEVKDKLLNVLQLQNDANSSELLLASITQKSNELQPVPFSKAINFSVNIKYLKYLCIPLFIWLLTFIVGIGDKLNQSFNRVVNHSLAYNPPAPFYFELTAKNLEVIKGDPITVYIQTKGEVVPNEAKIHFNNESYYLENNGTGLFSYTYDAVNEPIQFFIEANSIKSSDYQINIINTPSIKNISMKVIYPGYVGKKNEELNNASSITVPQGTSVIWNVLASDTDSVTYNHDNLKTPFTKVSQKEFSYKKRILNDTDYMISTSNAKLKNYEQLGFSIKTITDEFPSIEVKSNIDSVSRGPVFFAGQISDDYGFQKLEMVYYDSNNPNNQNSKIIQISKESVQSFFSKFPDNLDLKEGIDYELFFRVFDNDVISGYKKAVSKKFSYRKKTAQELDKELLNEQQNYLQNLQNSLQKQQDSKQELEKVQFDLQNKKNMNWNDQKKIESLIKRQEQYQNMMKRQTQKLQENFSEKKEENESLQKKKESLQKRIEELKKLEKQKKLLDELKKMAEKLNKEDLIKKSKQLAEQNKQQEKSLERVLELAKQYYVEQKMNQIAKKLDELAKKQEELSKKENENADAKQKEEALKEQKEIQKEFEEQKKELDALKKENQKLKRPMDLPSMEELKQKTDEQLNKAQENLENQKSQQAKKNQQKAAQKMKQMSQKMQNSMQMMNSEMAEENMEDLRRIVENLVTFSFDQESLMDKFSDINSSHPNFGKSLKKQYQLKTYFEHIDDSLFVLSLRVPDISSDIQNHLANAHYNLDESLENFTESRFRNGISNQRYVMTSANELTHMLSNTLDAMQNPQPGSGSGQGKSGQSFSLPDIIQKQENLMNQMKKGMQSKGNDGKPKNGKQGQKQDGKDGNKSGKEGEQGQQGKGGKGQNDDLNGELYEIFKQQSELRQQLEDAIKDGKDGNGQGKKAVKEMEQLENEILEKGFNQSTIQRMQRLNYQLLKLDKATFEQGKEKKRKSNTNLIQYNKNRAKEIEFKKQFYNQTEILNRQSLPLQQEYKKKVQEYFNTKTSTKK
ncbi:DUF4175 family protein [Tenacibaculum agarivorans]|uniref:DUF4175 family protein n=1 Tax=Tenacibaculum agarivorans TaxID=1908389 RepID=UPI00094B9919|nr:DUF4175 family protein [Tenacibaculum agarivorans]